MVTASLKYIFYASSNLFGVEPLCAYSMQRIKHYEYSSPEGWRSLDGGGVSLVWHQNDDTEHNRLFNSIYHQIYDMLAFRNTKFSKFFTSKDASQRVIHPHPIFIKGREMADVMNLHRGFENRLLVIAL